MRIIFLTLLVLSLSPLSASLFVPSWSGNSIKYEKNYLNQEVVLRTPNNITVVPSGRIFVRLALNVSSEDILSDYSLSVSFSLAVLSDIVVFQAESEEDAVEIAIQLQNDVRVLNVEPVWQRTIEYKAKLPDDPYMSLAWHLYDDLFEGDASVVEAWNYLEQHGVTPGEGIVIGIIDDGFDLGHEDLIDNFARGYDFEADDEYPLPFSSTPHGTSVTGVAAALSNNGIGVAGGCPHCIVVPVRMNSMNLDGASEVQAFDFLLKKDVDVISNSWGPMDNAGPKDMPGPLKELVEWAAKHGRNGKGTVILFAAGNGNESISDEKSFDGYAAHPDTIAVGAVNRDGFKTLYSDFGKDLDIVAPSCDIDTDAYYDTHVTYKYKDGIPTTDVRGLNGYRIGDYAPLFCGTSAATPLAASIVALTLSANYDLTLGELKEIMYASADKVSPDDALYDDKGFSTFYGYGRIDALEMVKKACASGCISADKREGLGHYSREELPPPVDHNGKMTTMTDDESIVPPALDGCSILFLP